MVLGQVSSYPSWVICNVVDSVRDALEDNMSWASEMSENGRSRGGGGCIYIYISAWGPIYGLPIKKNIRSFPQRTQLFPPKGESSVEVRRYSDAIGSAVSVWISMRAFVTPDLHRIPWESLGWDDLCEFDMGFSMGCWWMLMDFDGIVLGINGIQTSRLGTSVSTSLIWLPEIHRNGDT